MVTFFHTVNYLTWILLSTGSLIQSQQDFTFVVENSGLQLVPDISQILITNMSSIMPRVRCALACREHPLCRIFIHDQDSNVCVLYRSNTSGIMTMTSNRPNECIGRIRNEDQFYSSYSASCNQCVDSRFLTCQNGMCQCLPLTYWNGRRCEDQLGFGEPCSMVKMCREDLNLSCVFGTCQEKTAVCPINSTMIRFDDMTDVPIQGVVSAPYKNLQWTNALYLRLSNFTGTGYYLFANTTQYVGAFKYPLTIETLSSSQTFEFISFQAVAGWADTVNVNITGYNLNTTVASVVTGFSKYFVKTLLLEWKNLTKVIMIAYGPGYPDTGMYNLCVKF